MQTFLPYGDFAKSAECLDRARLGKQRLEAKWIHEALTTGVGRVLSHPAAKMWRGYEEGLAHYGLVICAEWRARNYKDTIAEYFVCQERNSNIMPPHFGASFHASHRSNLLRKDPIHYGQFGWTESADLPYIWPV